MSQSFVIAVLAAGCAAAAFAFSLPLAPQQLVGAACLVVAMVGAIVAMKGFTREKKRQDEEIQGTLLRQENLLRYQNDGLQTYLANLESFVKIELAGLEKKMTEMAADATAMDKAMSNFQKSVTTAMQTYEKGLARLEEKDTALGVALTTLAKAQENFRAKVAASLEGMGGAAREQTALLQQVQTMQEEGQTQNGAAFAEAQTAVTAIHSLLRDTASSLRTLQQECEAQAEHQNIGYDSLTALLAENRGHLMEINENVDNSLRLQQERGVLIEQGMGQLATENNQLKEMIQALAADHADEFEKQRLANEIVAQLLAENGQSVTAVRELSEEGFATQSRLLQENSRLLTDIKEKNVQEMGRQSQVLAALDSKVGSQQKAVLAALRQVEHSHRPQGRLEGDLRNMALADLLQILQLAKKTAAVFLKDIDGALYLEKGLLVYVRQGKFAGFQAFIRIMMIIHGYFSVRFDNLPHGLPKKPRPLIPELLAVIAEVDEIKTSLAALVEKVKKECGQDNFLVQLPDQDIDPAVLATFNYQAPARLEDLAVLMGRGVRENITLLEELHQSGRLTLIF